MKEAEPMRTKQINARTLTSLAYGINGAGGGGNVKELFNPHRNQNDIVGLVEEIGTESIPLVEWNEMNPNASVCCVARLGSPGARADQYGPQASVAIVEGLEQLANTLNKPFPAALFPVEATAGQMARVTRAALAARRKTGKPISIVDADVCGGMAVPAIPDAFRISSSLLKHPELALIELTENSEGNVKPKVEIFSEPNPTNLENMLRVKAGKAEMGAIWFAWLFTEAQSIPELFTPGAVSSSIRRGEIVRTAIKNQVDPAKELLERGEINGIVAKGKVTRTTKEQVPGFAQFSYEMTGETGKIAFHARNEYIVVHQNGKVIAQVPEIICVLGEGGPVQSHVLHEGDEITIVSALPQSLINNPEEREEWTKILDNYWKSQQEKDTWNHPYQFSSTA